MIATRGTQATSRFFVALCGNNGGLKRRVEAVNCGRGYQLTSCLCLRVALCLFGSDALVRPRILASRIEGIA